MRLRHLPRAIDVQGVCSMLDELGFSCAYDVVHVPGQRRQRLDRGYAFVNFLCPANAEACLRLCDRGSRERGSPSSCTAVYAECQGAGFVATPGETRNTPGGGEARRCASLVWVAST